jgi:uncharacterized protein
MVLPVCKTGLDRHSVFGFSCSRCLACCRNKKIQLNPYEIARLADNRGLSTAGLISQYTTSGGAFLRFGQDGACVFLNGQGCSVHSDRPLVCRLYPLGRRVEFSGPETFSQIDPDKECKGIFHEEGSIEDYLEEQGALPFMCAADKYLELLWFLLDILSGHKIEPSEAKAIVQVVRDLDNDDPINQQAFWLDMDAAVGEYCRENGIPAPTDLNEKMVIHIKAVREWTA